MKLRVWLTVVFGLVGAEMAHGEEGPTPPVDWRNEHPGFGAGLTFGPQGPGVSLRGWASPVLSIDVGGGLAHTVMTGSQVAEGRRTTAWLDVAQLGVWTGTQEGADIRSRTVAVELAPSVALHVFPAGLGRRQRR